MNHSDQPERRGSSRERRILTLLEQNRQLKRQLLETMTALKRAQANQSLKALCRNK
jgi:hypothetical protein